MAVWAYVCHSCEDDPPARWYASAALLAEMPTSTRIIRVKVGSKWLCAVVEDRGQPVAVEQMLVHDAIVSSEDDCPACREQLAAQVRSAPEAVVVGATQESPEPGVGSARAAAPKLRGSSGTVQAAAISLQGTQLAVVVVGMDLLRSVGEADMAIETLAPSFGGVPVVLMAQEEDGSPRYYGNAELVRLLKSIPLQRMPWREFPIG